MRKHGLASLTCVASLFVRRVTDAGLGLGLFDVGATPESLSRVEAFNPGTVWHAMLPSNRKMDGHAAATESTTATANTAANGERKQVLCMSVLGVPLLLPEFVLDWRAVRAS